MTTKYQSPESAILLEGNVVEHAVTYYLNDGCEVNEQDANGNTPLHRVISSDASKDVLRKLLQKGPSRGFDYHADEYREARGTSKEEENDRDECIKLILKNGADLSKRNKLGETPLFLADREKTISLLLDNSANIDERNGLNQTPLISYMCRPGGKIEIINLFLKRGADINARDKYGSSALHYAAWHDVGQDIVHSLMDNGAKLQPDSLNQLPCHVAYWRGSKRIFNRVCMCKDGHKGTGHFKFKRTVMDYWEMYKSSSEVLDRASRRFKFLRGRNISDVLNIPELGLVRFDVGTEAADVKSSVTEGIRMVCEEVAKAEKWLSCTYIQSGSMSEMTKVGVPDEFDFVCIFDKLSEVCYIDEQKSSTDPGFAYLKLKPEYSNLDCSDLFDKDGYLDVFQVRSRFRDVLESKISDSTIFYNPNLTFLRNHFEGHNKPTFRFALQWIGAFYKNMVIDIDMVPACQIKGFWPENANLKSRDCDVQELKEEGSLLILQTEFYPDDFEPAFMTNPKLRISALSAEQRHMQSLPSIAKEAYVISKILYNNRMCPTLITTMDVEAKDVIKSYMLKTCMFNVHHDMSVSNKDESVNYINKLEEDRYNDALYKYVLRIYQTFLKFSDEVLPSFIFPWQNVFTFAHLREDVHEKQNHCYFRRAYAKIILNILGKHIHFSDINPSAFISGVEPYCE